MTHVGARPTRQIRLMDTLISHMASGVGTGGYQAATGVECAGWYAGSKIAQHLSSSVNTLSGLVVQ